MPRPSSVTSPLPKAFGYARVSTPGQATEGISLSAQKDKIRLWAEAHGYHLASVHEDAGLSGGRADNRPGLQAVLDIVCAARGALVVFSLSRLARSTRDALQISERLDRAGADLVSLSERLDTSSSSGKMIFRLLAVLSEFERDQISERTRSAMQFLKSQGKRVGTIPLGFDLADDGETLLANGQEQDAIQVIHDLRAQGFTLRGIGQELQRRKVKSKQGLSTWTPKVIRDVLLREKPLPVTAGATR